MHKWTYIAAGSIVVSAATALLIGRAFEIKRVEDAERELIQRLTQPVADSIDFADLGELPAPVERYFRHVLADGQAWIKTARFSQKGSLRTRIEAENWSPFTATHLAVPLATGFVWNAKVKTPLATHVRVLDSYTASKGAGRVSLLSVISMASEVDTPELNSGALHRYLAEAVWYPTALLPQSGVVWTPVNDLSAIASLTDSVSTVSLEFRFNEVGEVTGIFTPARFGRFEGHYRQVPWEGHFRDYQTRSGMRIPLYGEVGWHRNGKLELVWKGKLSDTEYTFSQAS